MLSRRSNTWPLRNALKWKKSEESRLIREFWEHQHIGLDAGKKSEIHKSVGWLSENVKKFVQFYRRFPRKVGEDLFSVTIINKKKPSFHFPLPEVLFCLPHWRNSRVEKKVNCNSQHLFHYIAHYFFLEVNMCLLHYLYDQEEGYEEIRGEIEMLQQCSHPNVVRYFGSYQGEEYLWVWCFISVLAEKSCSISDIASYWFLIIV